MKKVDYMYIRGICYHFDALDHGAHIIRMLHKVRLHARPVEGIATAQGDASSALGAQQDRHQAEGLLVLHVGVHFLIELIRDAQQIAQGAKAIAAEGASAQDELHIRIVLG